MTTMSPSDAQLVAYLSNVSAQVSSYFSMFIFLTGTIGNILNIITLSQSGLRQIPCVFFLFVSSIASLISVGLGVVTRALSGWAVDPTYTIGWLCKMRTFLVYSTRAMVFWLFVAATVDRWLSSSVQIHRRNFSTLKNARRETMFIVMISLLIHAQILYCHDGNLTSGPFKCYAINHTCQLVSDVIFAGFTTIPPICCMLIFSLMTLSNIRQSQRRILQRGTATSSQQITTNTSTSQQRSKKVENQLVLMVLVQTVVLSVLTLPQAIHRLYVVGTESFHSAVQEAIDTAIYNIILLFTYLASALPFYIYTLTGGSLFRQALIESAKSIFKTITCQRRH